MRVPRLLIATLAGTTLLLSGFQNCSKTKFSASPDASSAGTSGAAGCGTDISKVTVPVKVLLVVDISGSNYGDGIIIGTDRDKSRRKGAIETFYEAYKQKSNLSWGFTVFGGDTSTSLIGSSNATAFTNISNTMYSAISVFNTITDSSLTPYSPALTLAKNIIKADTGASSDTKYVVVFISDGMPDPEISNSTLTNAVKAVTNAKPGAVTLSSIYYGFINQEASNILKSMATAGGGQFLDTNNNANGDDINIADVISVAGQKCP